MMQIQFICAKEMVPYFDKMKYMLQSRYKCIRLLYPANARRRVREST